MRTRILILAGLCLAAMPALAQPRQPDVAEGRRLAEQWCANCHRIAPAGPGPVTDAAPAFAAIAARPGTTQAGLSTFLRTPHATMPDHRLTLREAEDIAAYVLSAGRP